MRRKLLKRAKFCRFLSPSVIEPTQQGRYHSVGIYVSGFDMELLRQLRKSLTFGGLRIGMEISRSADGYEIVEAARYILLGLAKTIIPLRVRLARNMKLAGVYRRGLLDAYFARAIDQMVMIAHIIRTDLHQSGCLEKVVFDESFEYLKQAYSLGRGVINIAPHLCFYPIYPAVLNLRIPCSVYMRRNKDPRKRKIDESVARLGNAHLVYPPPGATKPQRFQIALNVLREGRMLFITPDTPKKPHEGVPVSIFGKRAYFPTGVFVMSMRTGAPIVPTVWRWDGKVYRVQYSEPIVLSRGGNLREKAKAAAQQWAKSVDDFLHECPEMWWNWLDKRWTRIIRTG